ncbi:MAG: site-specific DNA-methyltransferase [Dehalococcoidia bacterium]|nr:site-specific DNA-methyltransferase [Dehalococcoidia bacterium]
MVDNTSDGLAGFRALNEQFRRMPWPTPYDRTLHQMRLGDARDLSWIDSQSIDLIVTSPPYWTLKRYEDNENQLGHIEDYNQFLQELDRVWEECNRILRPGGRVCCVVGDVCLSRRQVGRHLVMPLHSDLQVRARKSGLDCLTPIIWHKIANGSTESSGNGAGFYGKPYQPGAIVKNDIEHILFFRKGGGYRSIDPLKKALSILTRDEMQTWFRSIWTDIKGQSTRNGHPAPYPVALADRLIRMFSFAGDTVLDPFAGTGSTALAAMRAGRNSISVEIEPQYFAAAEANLRESTPRPSDPGEAKAYVEVIA